LQYYNNDTKLITAKSLNLISDNSEILIIQHLNRVVSRNKYGFLPEKSFINGTSTSQDLFKQTSRSVSTSTIVVSPDPLSLLHQLFQLWRL